MDAIIARSFPFANLGTTIAARMPMMTTTISSSISVKPLSCLIALSPRLAADAAGSVLAMVRGVRSVSSEEEERGGDHEDTAPSTHPNPGALVAGRGTLGGDS